MLQRTTVVDDVEPCHHVLGYRLIHVMDVLCPFIIRIIHSFDAAGTEGGTQERLRSGAEREMLARQLGRVSGGLCAARSELLDFRRMQAQALPTDRQHTLEGSARLTSVPHETQIVKGDVHLVQGSVPTCKKKLESYR